jgi:multiple sugar transport system permease protein
MLWMWILHPEFGLVNYALSAIGINGPRWLSDPQWAKPSLIMIRLWAGAGGSTMIIFLAALQGVPQELHESAAIDGANAWHRFWNITIPMLTPAIFMTMVLQLIAALRVFAMAFVATGGGPMYATYFYILHLFNNAFMYMKMGYASSLAWVFTILVLLLTIIQFKLSGRWVYYAGE